MGRVFLKKLEDRLRAQHYLHPHNRILLLTETSGTIEYRKGAVTTRPPDFSNTPFFRAPLVAVQTPPYVMRMRG